MSQPLILRIYLHHPILQTATQGKLGFINRLRDLLTPRGWQIQILRSGPAARAEAPGLPGYALFHMERPTHDHALTFRLAYHYPFWRIEQNPERWRWPVAQEKFKPKDIDRAAADEFAARLRQRVLPGPPPQTGDHVLIPLQGRISDQRSFQATSPLRMVEAIAQTGRPSIATLHPKESYSDQELASLYGLAAKYPNLTIGGDTMALLRDCAFVAAQNSAVAFDGFILGKPAVLFGQVDFHHIALNVPRIGIGKALSRIPGHKPAYSRYLDWFLRQQSLDMSAADADDRMLAALRSGGWPV